MVSNSNGTQAQKAANIVIPEHNVFIVWQPEYNIGIHIIDEQHRGIVSTINSLYYGMQNNYIKEMLTSIVGMMYDYTHIHFHIEEDFLTKIDFPNAKKHRELHQELTYQLAKMGRDSLLEKDSIKFLEFLKKWWINHICCEDLIFRNHILSLQ